MKILTLFAALFLAADASAGSLPGVIDPQVTVTDPGTLISGGAYIGPYELYVAGFGYFLGMCIDENIETQLNVPWNATATQMTVGTSAGFLEQAWLLSQLTTPGQTDANRIAIQDAAWGQDNAWSALAPANYLSVDPARYWLLTPDTPGEAQRFIIDPLVQTTPEPAYYALLGIGAILFGAIRRRKNKRGRYTEKAPEDHAAALAAVATQ